MISIDNFYWLLFENLLKPTGLDCWYYYPWGAKDNLSRNEFKALTGRYDYNHVFFHFEQEPLWSDQLGIYDLDGKSWSYKFARILANSEFSQTKKKLCTSRGFIDWYFFYHGFVALDWYRDAQYIQQQNQFTNVFLSLNHVFDQRAYRLALLVRLIDSGVVDKGSISFHASFADIYSKLTDQDPQLSMASQNLIHCHINVLSTLPWSLDAVPVNGNLSARFGHREYKLWQNSFLHLVNETVFHEPKLHLTEKVFKPIIAQRPFMLVAAPGNLEYFRSYGFQTFGAWIDESYDKILDEDKRLDAICAEVCRFSQMSISDLTAIYHDMASVLEFNKQHFFGEFRRIIVDELIENFDQCIRIWNNGVPIGRELHLHPDLKSVRQIFLQ